ncbi:unnamed protein product [Danaus chrysippus]|uniref:(African queen) hypothetical protein n=1 Tax=Danaus chrysippus TaxID=151541 RepID=A0A8J2VWV9_9NEOP|nr:unnamed protein product [Danaus chrysippus]
MEARERRARRGPAPIASFDHDASDESSPENKQAIRLPEIREDPASSSCNVAESTSTGDGLAPPEQRARSLSSPAVHTVTPVALQTPSAPRIDISRASSSSHHDSRDSSPELALFAGGGSSEETRQRLELGFREDGALDLRSSTEELAFLEGAPEAADVRPPAVAQPSRRHSRKDSQSSEAALLAVSGRTSRLSSVGSQCSAHSAISAFSQLSRVSRLSVVSGTSRSPSPHKMLLETSFCGPKPIETDPEICAAAVEERLLEIAKLTNDTGAASSSEPQPLPVQTIPIAIDARDRREVRTEVTLENTRPASAPKLTSPSAPPTTPVPELAVSTTSLDDDKRLKETRNRAKVEEHRARSRDRRETKKPEVYRAGNKSKDIIRIKLKPDSEYDDDEEGESETTLVSNEPAKKPVTLELSDQCSKPTKPVSPLVTARRQRDSRTPSPSGVPVSRKSSFCSLFKSRETIASPDSPSDVFRRKKSLNEGRSRSKSRDLVQQQRQFPQTPHDKQRGEKLKYYEDAKDGIIHIPLRTPPDEFEPKNGKESSDDKITGKPREVIRPASAPQPRALPERSLVMSPAPSPKPTQRTVLPDGSIIIPLHSPTDKTAKVIPPFETQLKSESDIKYPKQIDLNHKELNLYNNIKHKEPDYATEKIESIPTESDGSQFISSPPPDIVPETYIGERPRRKERIVFTTHVGSKEHVFSTQFSITKTPSVTSEISESIQSVPEFEEVKPNEPSPQEADWKSTDVIDNDPQIHTQRETFCEAGEENVTRELSREVSREVSPTPEAGRDSSGSETSLEIAATHGGSDAERRGLVVQESFEELPYVPTTLPLERSLALPMVPVRERGGVHVAGVQRPRATRSASRQPGALTPPTPAAPSPATADSPADRLYIKLPRRARTVSTASAAPPPPPRNLRTRSRSGGDAASMETRSKSDWIDFSEVPERRKQPKRIQTLPASARDSVVFSYVPPERCRCDCHAHDPADDEQPLLDQPARREPFVADLDVDSVHLVYHLRRSSLLVSPSSH